MTITDFGVAVVEGDTHLSKWIVEQKRLAVAQEFIAQFEKHIPEGGVVVDVGACIGDHTETYAELVGPNGKVHAFEPHREAFDCLSFNMRKRRNVFCYPVGLGAESGQAVCNPSPNLGASQLEKSKHGPITVLTLDSIAFQWPKLDFVKIDAEGWEPEILLGARKTLRRLRPVMLVELNRPVLKARGKTDEDLLSALKLLGYTAQPCEDRIPFDSPQLDLLCLP